jgi:hypothetical protein
MMHRGEFEKIMLPNGAVKDILSILIKNINTRFDARMLKNLVGGSLEHISRCLHLLYKKGFVNRSIPVPSGEESPRLYYGYKLKAGNQYRFRQEYVCNISDFDKIRLTGKEFSVLSAIAGHIGVLTAPQIAKMEGITLQAARKRLSMLHKKGYILFNKDEAEIKKW